MSNPWLEVLGRCHPVVLHLPIGVLLGLAGLEFGGLLLRRPLPRGPALALAWFGALSALLAAGSGWLLAAGGDYDAALLLDHRRLGLATASAALLTAFAALRPGRLAFRVLLLLTCLVLLPTGHHGGQLTHGAGFLFAPLQPGNAAPRHPDAGHEAPVADDPFTAVVQPILTRTCTGCHGAEKQKADLRLDSAAAVLLGGENGKVVVPGDPDGSELLHRLLLPHDDKEHMPPKGKPQPTAAEIEALRAWIAAGAATGTGARTKDGETSPPPTAATTPTAPAPAPAPAAAIAAFAQRLVHAAPLAQDSPWLTVDFAAVATSLPEAEVIALLEPVAPWVARLSLARSACGDATLALVRRMPQLQRLDLRATAVTSAGLQACDGHARLEDLVLAQTRVDDAAVPLLLALPALRALHVFGAAFTEAGLQQLQAKAGLRLETGAAPTAAAEPEPEVKFSNDAPVPGQPAAAELAKALQPSNPCCPITQKPLDPRFSLVVDGKVIGFCCGDCLQQYVRERLRK